MNNKHYITSFLMVLMIASFVSADNYIGDSLTYFSSANLAIGKSTATERLDVSGNIAVSGTVDGRDIASDGSTLDTLDGDLGSITSAEADQIENIGATTISGAQWGYLGATDQGLSTSNNVDFNTITASPSSAVTALTIEQNYDAVGLHIDMNGANYAGVIDGGAQNQIIELISNDPLVGMTLTDSAGSCNLYKSNSGSCPSGTSIGTNNGIALCLVC